MAGFVRIPKFRIEEMNEVAICDKITRLESQLSGMNTLIIQHMVDSDTAMTSINTSLVQHTVDISNLKENNNLPISKLVIAIHETLWEMMDELMNFH